MRPLTDEEWFAGLEKGAEELGKNRRGNAKVAGGGSDEKEEDLEGGDYAVSVGVCNPSSEMFLSFGRYGQFESCY